MQCKSCINYGIDIMHFRNDHNVMNFAFEVFNEKHVARLSAIKLLVVNLDVVSPYIIVKNLVLFVASILTLFMHLVFF